MAVQCEPLAPPLSLWAPQAPYTMCETARLDIDKNEEKAMLEPQSSTRTEAWRASAWQPWPRVCAGSLTEGCAYDECFIHNGCGT